MEFKIVINACLGTPPQSFNFGIQTNTFYIWVRSSKSSEKDSKKSFNITHSKTLHKNKQYFQSLIFGRKVTGFEAKDILTIDRKDYSKIILIIIS